MRIPSKRSKHLLVAGLLAVTVGCGSSSSNPDAGGGGHAAGGGAGHASGGAAGHAAGGGGGMAAGTGGVGGQAAAGGTAGPGGNGGGPATGGGGVAGSTGAGGGMTGTAGAGGSAGPIEFTDFVNDLIKNKTAPNTTPESLNEKTFKDSMNPAAFSTLFP